MKKDLTSGPIFKSLILFSLPMILGNLLQQVYNIADSFIVGQYVSADALAAVGSAYSLMTFLTSIIIGLCMGSGACFSFYYEQKDFEQLKKNISLAFVLTGAVTIVINIVVFIFIDGILRLLQVPPKLYEMMRVYVFIIFFGLFFTFLYNFFAYLLRGLGNSVVPLYVLGSAAVLNIILDIFFVLGLQMGVKGAAIATVIAQMEAGIVLTVYAWKKEPLLRLNLTGLSLRKKNLAELCRFSFTSSLQQSVMNFGILMIQGLVNSFGPAVMSAFAAAVKVDSLAYMPAQEFGNAYSLFISQNYGAGQSGRIKKGTGQALCISSAFCLFISVLVCVFARSLMLVFIKESNADIIRIGMEYLRIEGACYIGIGILFLLYGYFRGINRPEMSLILTILSLGTRVLLAYTLAPIPAVGVRGIWAAIPIGWALADTAGLISMGKYRKQTSGK